MTKWTLFVVAAAASATMGCGGDAKAGKSDKQPVPVTVAKVTVEDVPFELAAFGTVEASSSVDVVRITSPLGGKTGSLLVHAGNLVRAGETQPLVVIRSPSPVQVRFAVPEEYLTRVRERMAAGALFVRVTPKGQVGPVIEGPVTFLENTVDTATGTLSLKATFANRGEELWPGEAVDVRLVLDTDKRAIVAPEAAVQDGQDGKYAFVIEGGKAKLRRADVLRTTPTVALVRAGLRPGEDVSPAVKSVFATARPWP